MVWMVVKTIIQTGISENLQFLFLTITGWFIIVRGFVA